MSDYDDDNMMYDSEIDDMDYDMDMEDDDDENDPEVQAENQYFEAKGSSLPPFTSFPLISFSPFP